jgi:hypothetical protein
MPQLDHRFMNAHLVTHRGHLMVAIGNREYSVPAAAKLCGMPIGTLKSRLRAGMNIAEAMTRQVTEHGDRRRPAP